MPDDSRREPDEEAPNPLLTPKESEAVRAARELRKRSEQLVRASARASSPKDLIHRFPPPPDARPPADHD